MRLLRKAAFRVVRIVMRSERQHANDTRFVIDAENATPFRRAIESYGRRPTLGKPAALQGILLGVAS